LLLADSCPRIEISSKHDTSAAGMVFEYTSSLGISFMLE